MQKVINFNDFAIAFVKGSDYKIQFWYISKDDAINVMKYSDLNKKKWIAVNFFLRYIKMSEKTTYDKRNKEAILNRANNVNIENCQKKKKV